MHIKNITGQRADRQDTIIWLKLMHMKRMPERMTRVCSITDNQCSIQLEIRIVNYLNGALVNKERKKYGNFI